MAWRASTPPRCSTRATRPRWLEAIAERLATIEPLPTEDERAILPTQPIDKARALANYLATKAAGTTALLGADQVVAALGDGYAALRPAVHLLAEPDVDKLNIELPFPCVWVSPWSRAAGLEPLRHSLVVNAITGDDELIDDLLDEPTVDQRLPRPPPDVLWRTRNPARRIPGGRPDAQQRFHQGLSGAGVGQ